MVARDRRSGSTRPGRTPASQIRNMRVVLVVLLSLSMGYVSARLAFDNRIYQVLPKGSDLVASHQEVYPARSFELRLGDTQRTLVAACLGPAHIIASNESQCDVLLWKAREQGLHQIAPGMRASVNAHDVVLLVHSSSPTCPLLVKASMTVFKEDLNSFLHFWDSISKAKIPSTLEVLSHCQDISLAASTIVDRPVEPTRLASERPKELHRGLLEEFVTFLWSKVFHQIPSLTNSVMQD